MAHRIRHVTLTRFSASLFPFSLGNQEIDVETTIVNFPYFYFYLFCFVFLVGDRLVIAVKIKQPELITQKQTNLLLN